MGKELNNKDRLDGRNPFRVPEGYMENLTEGIMSRLPEKSHEEVRQVTLVDRIRPWLYMAAVFAGLGLFFKAIVGFEGGKESAASVQLTDIHDTKAAMHEAEDEEYLEYLEIQFTDCLLAEELSNYE